jgi:hypothetical protein
MGMLLFGIKVIVYFMPQHLQSVQIMMEGSKPLEIEKAMEDAQVAITPPKEDYNNIHKCTIVKNDAKLHNIFGHD